MGTVRTSSRVHPTGAGWRRVGLSLLAAAAVGLLTACVPDEQVFVVDNLADAPAATVGDGVCESTVGGCTLRAAVQEANALVDATALIELGDGNTYTLGLAGPGDDSAAVGDLDTTGTVVIRGSSTIDADGLDRVFDVHSGRLVLEGVTITGGSATEGAGVRVSGGHLALRQATVTGGTAERGGGLFVTPEASSDVLESTISDNVATATFWCFAGSPTQIECGGTGAGGGVYNSGTVVLVRSTVSGNEAPGGNGFDSWGEGAGLFSRSLMIVDQSTIADNTLNGGLGAGIAVRAGMNWVVSSTVAGNDAGTRALGDQVHQVNQSEGGGVVFAGSVVAGPSPACKGWMGSLGYSTRPDTSCPGFNQTGDQLADAALGALGDNGGPTQTMLPGAGSPVVGTIPSGTVVQFGETVVQLCTESKPVDQRGQPRPSDIACDMGSVERQPSDP